MPTTMAKIFTISPYLAQSWFTAMYLQRPSRRSMISSIPRSRNSQTRPLR